jgi:hypothetical protein
VKFAGAEAAALTGKLGGAVELDGCTWTLDGKGNVVITLAKQGSGEWPFALKQI